MAFVLRMIRTVFYKLAVTGITFLSSVLITRYLPVSSRGVYTETTTALLLFSSFLAGYSNFFNYGINRLKYDRQDVFSVLLRQYALICVGIVLMLIASLIGIQFNSFFIYTALLMVTLPFTLFLAFATKFVNALNQIDLLNRLNMLQSVMMFFFVILLFCTSKWHFFGSKFPLLPFTFTGWTLSYVLAAAIAMVFALRVGQVRIRPRKDQEIGKKLGDYGHKISMQSFLTLLNYRGDLYFVGLLAGSTLLARQVSAGLYGIAVTASEILWQVSQSVAVLVYSRVATEERNNSTVLTERMFRYTFWLLVVLGIIMAILSPLIPIVFGARYHPSIAPFEVLLVGTAAYGAIGLLTQYFTDQLGKVKYPMIMQIVSIVVNASICLLTIPHVGMIGGAIASSTAYLVALGMSVTYFRFHAKRPLRYLFLPTKQDAELAVRIVSRFRRVNKASK